MREAKPFLACHVSEADQKVLLEELRHVEAAGQEVEYEALTGASAREMEPALSDAVGTAASGSSTSFDTCGHSPTPSAAVGATCGSGWTCAKSATTEQGCRGDGKR